MNAEFELRVLIRRVHTERVSHKEFLQQRTKTKWIDGSSTGNGYYTWTEWEDVPIVQED